MATITIRNVGPINSIENLALNSVNVFMGPQSSGKSTIAKIISYCIWVEKDVATSQSLNDYNSNGNFRKKLEDFHRLGGYFKADSEIHYESDVISLHFRNNQCSIEWKDKYAYKHSKIAYIPAERNLVLLPMLQKVDLSNNNIRSFLFDWLTIRNQYNKENRVNILGLPYEYYFDEGTGESHISSSNENDRYDILLENASSGLQSLTPLAVALKYLTEWIYENEEEVSFEKSLKYTGFIHTLMDKLAHTKYTNQEYVIDDNWVKLQEYLNTTVITPSDFKEMSTIPWHNIMKLNFTQFIIEEPEQNLFPSTQRDLVYHIINSLNFERGDRATLTTHSPYILYALNNCMMGYLVTNQLDGAEKEEYLSNDFLSRSSWIDPKSVSIWEITDEGKLRYIQDKDGIVSENYFDQKMTELTDEYYQMLSYYKNEK